MMVVPVTEQGDLLLVREYAAGTERYELGFPKGLIDPGLAFNFAVRMDVSIVHKLNNTKLQ